MYFCTIFSKFTTLKTVSKVYSMYLVIDMTSSYLPLWVIVINKEYKFKLYYKLDISTIDFISNIVLFYFMNFS